MAVPGHCALALKLMLFRHLGALSFVSIYCGVLLTLHCSFIICCSCSCSSLLEAIPSIVSCTIFCIYQSDRFVDRPFRARHLVTAATSNRRETWVKNMALMESCADKCPCPGTVPEYYLRRECPYPGTVLKFLYGHR